MQTPRLMAVLAHPDDESLGLGGTLAKYTRATAGYVRPTRLHQQSPGDLEKALFAFNTAQTRFLEFG